MKKFLPLMLFAVLLAAAALGQSTIPTRIVVQKVSKQETPKKEKTAPQRPERSYAKKNVTTEQQTKELNTYTLQQGYRGFVDVGWFYATDDEIYGREFATSHGIQFNRFLYMGLGAAINFSDGLGNPEPFIPLFADIRLDFGKGKYIPFLDTRVGMDLADGDYGYFSGAIGMRIANPRHANAAFNITASFEYKPIKYYYYLTFWSDTRTSHADGSLSLKIGYEF